MNRKSLFASIFAIVFLFTMSSVALARGQGQGRGVQPDQAMGRGIHHGRSQDRGPDKTEHCLADLDLSSEQIGTLRQIREEHLQNMARIRDDMGKYRAQQRKEFNKGEGADQGQKEEIINQVGELWKEREREMQRYREQVSSLLTQEQKDKLYMCEGFGLRQKGDISATKTVQPAEPAKSKK